LGSGDGAIEQTCWWCMNEGMNLDLTGWMRCL